MIQEIDVQRESESRLWWAGFGGNAELGRRKSGRAAAFALLLGSAQGRCDCYWVGVP